MNKPYRVGTDLLVSCPSGCDNCEYLELKHMVFRACTKTVAGVRAQKIGGKIADLSSCKALCTLLLKAECNGDIVQIEDRWYEVVQ